MINIIHVIVRLRDQEVCFNGESYPYYAIGWKENNDITLWDGRKIGMDEVDSWKAI